MDTPTIIAIIGQAAAGLLASAVATAFVTPTFRQVRRRYLRSRRPTGEAPVTPAPRITRRRRARLAATPAPRLGASA
jgi:hypothetical protein